MQRDAVEALRGEALEFEFGDHAGPSMAGAASARDGDAVRVGGRPVEPRRRISAHGAAGGGAAPGQAGRGERRQGQAPRSCDPCVECVRVNMGRQCSRAPRRVWESRCPP